MAKALLYGTAVVLHDGSGHFRGGLVFSQRTDLGGPDDEPVLTVITLDPAYEPHGAARGNVIDAAVVLHDLPFVESADKAGYSFGVFDDEVRMQLEVKKVVMASPVAPVLVNPPGSSATPQAPVRMAIVGGIPVETSSAGMGIEHEASYAAMAVAPEPTLTGDQKASELLTEQVATLSAENAELKEEAHATEVLEHGTPEEAHEQAEAAEHYEKHEDVVANQPEVADTSHEGEGQPV